MPDSRPPRSEDPSPTARSVSPPASALQAAAVDTERHVARAGWDQPPRMFALVSNALLAQREPSMGDELRDADPAGFTAVEQDSLPQTSDLESMLARVAWGQDVTGVALSIERIVVPPEAERDLSPDPQEATEALARHPDRQDVRILAAVERTGVSICLLRQRRHDSDDAVAIGADIAPGLLHALSLTLQDDDSTTGPQELGDQL